MFFIIVEDGACFVKSALSFGRFLVEALVEGLNGTEFLIMISVF